MTPETPRYVDKTSGTSTDHAEKIALRFDYTSETQDKYSKLREGLKEIVSSRLPKREPLTWKTAADPYPVDEKSDVRGLLDVIKRELPKSNLIDSKYAGLAYSTIFKTVNMAPPAAGESKIADVNWLEPGDKIFVENGTVHVVRKEGSAYSDFTADLYPWGEGGTTIDITPVPPKPKAKPQAPKSETPKSETPKTDAPEPEQKKDKKILDTPPEGIEMGGKTFIGKYKEENDLKIPTKGYYEWTESDGTLRTAFLDQSGIYLTVENGKWNEKGTLTDGKAIYTSGTVEVWKDGKLISTTETAPAPAPETTTEVLKTDKEGIDYDGAKYFGTYSIENGKIVPIDGNTAKGTAREMEVVFYQKGFIQKVETGPRDSKGFLIEGLKTYTDGTIKKGKFDANRHFLSEGQVTESDGILKEGKWDEKGDSTRFLVWNPKKTLVQLYINGEEKPSEISTLIVNGKPYFGTMDGQDKPLEGRYEWWDQDSLSFKTEEVHSGAPTETTEQSIEWKTDSGNGTFKGALKEGKPYRGTWWREDAHEYMYYNEGKVTVKTWGEKLNQSPTAPGGEGAVITGAETRFFPNGPVTTWRVDTVDILKDRDGSVEENGENLTDLFKGTLTLNADNNIAFPYIQVDYREKEEAKVAYIRYNYDKKQYETDDGRMASESLKTILGLLAKEAGREDLPLLLQQLNAETDPAKIETGVREYLANFYSKFGAGFTLPPEKKYDYSDIRTHLPEITKGIELAVKDPTTATVLKSHWVLLGEQGSIDDEDARPVITSNEATAIVIDYDESAENIASSLKKNAENLALKDGVETELKSLGEKYKVLLFLFDRKYDFKDLQKNLGNIEEALKIVQAKTTPAFQEKLSKKGIYLGTNSFNGNGGDGVISEDGEALAYFWIDYDEKPEEIANDIQKYMKQIYPELATEVNPKPAPAAPATEPKPAPAEKTEIKGEDLMENYDQVIKEKAREATVLKPAKDAKAAPFENYTAPEVKIVFRGEDKNHTLEFGTWLKKPTLTSAEASFITKDLNAQWLKLMKEKKQETSAEDYQAFIDSTIAAFKGQKTEGGYENKPFYSENGMVYFADFGVDDIINGTDKVHPRDNPQKVADDLNVAWVKALSEPAETPKPTPAPAPIATPKPATPERAKGAAPSNGELTDDLKEDE